MSNQDQPNVEETMENLKEAISDIGRTSDNLQQAVVKILNEGSISAKGMRRVLTSIMSFPKSGGKVITEQEGALIIAFSDKIKMVAQQINLAAHLNMLEEKVKQTQKQEN